MNHTCIIHVSYMYHSCIIHESYSFRKISFRYHSTSFYYVDGVLNFSNSVPLVSLDSEPLIIGAGYYLSLTNILYFFNGTIDDFRIYDRILNANEVVRIFQECTQ